MSQKYIFGRSVILFTGDPSVYGLRRWIIPLLSRTPIHDFTVFPSMPTASDMLSYTSSCPVRDAASSMNSSNFSMSRTLMICDTSFSMYVEM